MGRVCEVLTHLPHIVIAPQQGATSKYVQKDLVEPGQLNICFFSKPVATIFCDFGYRNNCLLYFNLSLTPPPFIP